MNDTPYGFRLAKVKAEGHVVAYDEPLPILKAALVAVESMKRNKRLKTQVGDALRIAITELERNATNG